MRKKNLTRRKFLTTASVGTMAAVTSGGIGTYGNISKKAAKLAIHGGQQVRSKPYPAWPQPDEVIGKSLNSAFRTGKWCRFDGGAEMTSTFEKKLAKLNGINRCVATGSGTQALHSSLYAVGVEAGDEVLVTPYTFIASVNAITLLNALPVFVDVDIETFQMDPAKMEEKINGNTKAIEPVHICGLAADMDRINSIAEKHNLKVVEDACQALFTEYKGRKCGTMGDIGCFSFQSSKIIHSGEGGAAIGNNDKLMDRCYSFHTLGEGGLSDRRRWAISAPKYRMNEFEASVLLPQLDLLEERVNRRTENAKYLTSGLKEIPGIIPQKHYEGQGRATYYLYEIRYKKEYFNDVPRDIFYNALKAEGIPSWLQSPYELNKEPVIENTLNSRIFKKIYSKERLKRYREENECPQNAQRCKEGLGIWHWALSGTKKDIDDIVNAFQKIYENRDKLV